MNTMNTIYQCGRISLLLLAAGSPAAFAEPQAVPERVIPTDKTKATGAAWRANEIIGADVRNAGDEKIGKVEDLIIDMTGEGVLGVVISTGGFLGVADRLTSVPASELRYDTEAKAFKTKLTKAELGAKPAYDAKTWAEQWAVTRGAMEGKLGKARDAVEKAAEKDAEPSASGTAKVTPLDQGSSPEDVKTTRDIRASLMDEKLSFGAKNIRVITRDGKVTLKGTVDSKAEHEAVLEVVDRHVGKSMVADHLEVKK